MFFENLVRGAAVLIELDVPAAEDTSCGDIEKFVGVFPRCVPEHEALGALWSKLSLTLVFGNEGVGGASKGTEECGVNRTLKQDLIGCFALKAPGRTAGDDVCST